MDDVVRTLPASMHLSTEQIAEIRRHAEATYPDECCGALLSRDGHYQGRGGNPSQ